MFNSNEFKKLYTDWLYNNIEIEVLSNCTEISFPFLDRHNDYLQIYIEKYENGYRLSDDSYTISDLNICDVDILTSDYRKNILNCILKSTNVQIKSEELFIFSDKVNLIKNCNNLLQAMSSVNDMYMLSKPNISKLFNEDVSSFFQTNHVKFKRNYKAKGKSTYNHSFDFLIPDKNILINTIYEPTKSNIEKTLFECMDIRQRNTCNFQFTIILNDSIKDIKPDVTSALNQYDVHYNNWSNKDNILSFVA